MRQPSTDDKMKIGRLQWRLVEDWKSAFASREEILHLGIEAGRLLYWRD